MDNFNRAAVCPDMEAPAPYSAVPIVFAADKHYGFYLAAAVQSVIENASLERRYVIIVLDCGIKAEALAALKRQLGARAPQFSLRIFALEDILAEHRAILPEKYYFTRAMYARLFIPALCRDYEKVIYADCDIVFRADAAELLRTDLGSCYIAAAIDAPIAAYRQERKSVNAYMHEVLRLEDEDIYINSGVLLFNISAWRARKLTEKALGLLAAHRLSSPDQDAINSVCKAKIHVLPAEWNALAVESLWPKGMEKAKLIHYVGYHKPWNNANVHGGAFWWDYAVKTELFARYHYQMLGQALPQTYKSSIWRCFGLLIFQVKNSYKERKYFIGRFRFMKKEITESGATIYLLGVKAFTVTRQQR